MKTKRKLNDTEFDIVKIEWRDAFSESNWTRIKRITDEDIVPVNCVTIGYRIKEDKEHVLISGTVSDCGDTTGMMCVPKGMVRSIRILHKRNT